MAWVSPVCGLAEQVRSRWRGPIPLLRVVLDSQNVDTPADNSHHSQTSLTAKIGWGALIVAALYVCYFSHLGAIGFVGPDEPRYAWIARDMMESGDWVTPRLYGKPWFEKPPLLYWGAGLCFKWFGVSEAAARLPSAVSALLATLALAWLALRLYGAETARWLLLLLPTTVGMIGFSHAAATDMPFSGMLTAAMVCAAVILGLTRNEYTPILPRTPWFALLLFGFFLGLAVLAKGPAAIVLCGGAVFFWALFTRHWRDALRLLHPIGIASFCLTALPWYIQCAQRNPDFFRVFIIEHNFKRFLTPEFQHIQPFWFYFPVLLVAFLPWTGAVVWALLVGLTRTVRLKRLSPAIVFLLSWSAFVVFFFSISQSKLPGYVLPAMPAIGLLLARSCTRPAVERRKSFGLTLTVFALLFFAAGEFVLHGLTRLRSPALEFTFPFALLLLTFALLNALLAAEFTIAVGWTRRLVAVACVIPILLLLNLEDTLASGPFHFSAKELAVQLRHYSVPADRVFIDGGTGMKRSDRYALNFYLHRELPDWDQSSRVEAYVVSGTNRCEQLKRQGMDCEELWLRYTPESLVTHLKLSNLVDGPGDRDGRQAQQEK